MNSVNILLNSNDEDSIINSGRIYFSGLRSAYAEVFNLFYYLIVILISNQSHILSICMLKMIQTQGVY